MFLAFFRDGFEGFWVVGVGFDAVEGLVFAMLGWIDGEMGCRWRGFFLDRWMDVRCFVLVRLEGKNGRSRSVLICVYMAE